MAECFFLFDRLKRCIRSREMAARTSFPLLSFSSSCRTSLFIIMSFIYAKLLVVVCIAYVISEVVTHKLPLYYYEGFFTYLYGVSILFLLYVFCFLLQESACCSRGSDTPPPPPRPPKPPKEPKEKNKKKDKKDKEQKSSKNKKEYQVRIDLSSP